MKNHTNDRTPCNRRNFDSTKCTGKPKNDRINQAVAVSIETIIRNIAKSVSGQRAQQEIELKARMGRAISLVPGKSEEHIGGLPINMEGFHLFDAEHRSSDPLCIAYEAARLAAPERAHEFLKLLRRTTIVETRQTTRFEELLQVAKDVGIDEMAFTGYYEDGTASGAFEEDLNLTASLGLRGLPAYIIEYGGKALLLQSFEYAAFEEAIDRLMMERG